jgi:putative lipase involved disintegration of autophagic bodies
MKRDDAMTIGAIFGVLVFLWLASSAFHFIPIDGDFRWWHYPWSMTVVFGSAAVGWFTMYKLADILVGWKK